MTKPAKLVVRIAEEGDWQRFLFAGAMTEDTKSSLTPLLLKAGKRVVLDLGDVTYMNSIGIRDWSHFLKGLKPGRELAYDRLPEDVVQTMNMITNFHMHVPVRSVFRTYGCEHCGNEQTERFDVGADYAQGKIPRPAAKTCKSCGKATEPLTDDEAFFAFLLSA